MLRNLPGRVSKIDSSALKEDILQQWRKQFNEEKELEISGEAKQLIKNSLTRLPSEKVSITVKLEMLK